MTMTSNTIGWEDWAGDTKLKKNVQYDYDKHNEPDVLSNRKTDLPSPRDI